MGPWMGVVGEGMFSVISHFITINVRLNADNADNIFGYMKTMKRQFSNTNRIANNLMLLIITNDRLLFDPYLGKFLMSM